MLVCAINGSHRGSRGATHRLLERMGAGVRGAGGTWDPVQLAELRIEPCRACNQCQRSGSFQCIYEDKDQVRQVFERLAAADIVVYASPIYVLGLSSLLRRFMERFYSLAPIQGLRLTESGLFFHAVDRAICGKPFVSLLVCDNLEDLTVRNARDGFRILSRFLDAPQVGHLERRSAAAWTKALQGDDPAEKQRAEAILESFETAGRDLVTQGRIRPSTARAAGQPFVQVPALVRLARHLPFLRPRIAQEIQRRAGTSTMGPD